MMDDTEMRRERAVVTRVFRRIVPLCFLLYIISYIERANIGYAALQMNAELGLSSEAFGLAAGIFFIGYFLLEVPSNMLMARYGARVWIARILIGMGVVSMASAFVQSAGQLYVARFLLGDVETLTARTQRVNRNIAGEDVATMLLEHVPGVTSVVDCSYATKLPVEPFPETLVEIDGDEGTIRLSQGYRLQVQGRAGATTRDVSPLLLPWASRPWHNIQESVAAIQKHWVECLTAGKEPATSGADNLRTFALVEAAYTGAASGQPVRIDDLLK